MKFKQREKNDCLVCAVENLLKLPREALPPIEKTFGGCASYRWVASTLNEYGNFKCECFLDFNGNFIPLQPRKCQAILGLGWEGRNLFHATYQDLDRVWCGHVSDFIENEGYFRDAFHVYRIVPSIVPDLNFLYKWQDHIEKYYKDNT